MRAKPKPQSHKSKNPFDWKIANLDELAKVVADKPLKESVFDVDLATVAVDAPLDVPALEGLKLGISASAVTKARAFVTHEKKKPDEDGVVSDKPSGEDASSPTAPLLFGKDAWIKYGVTLRAKASAGVDLPYISPEASGELHFHIADYHRHAPAEKARAAALSDIKSLRAPFIIENVLALGEREALCFRTYGKLGAQVKVKWSDVLTLGLASLSSALRLTSTLAIAINASAFVSGGVTFQDSFDIVFSRDKAGEVLVSVRKAPSLAVTGGAGVEVSVGIEEGSVKPAVDAVMNAITDLPKKKQVTTLKSLGAGTGAAEKMTWDEITKTLTDKLIELAKSKLTAAFTFEYGFVADNAALLEMRLTDARVKELFGDIFKGRLTELDAKLKPGEMVRGFYREKLTKTRAWGFSLTLGKWKLNSKDAVKREAVTQFKSLRREGLCKKSFDLSRSYRDEAFGLVTQSSVTLTATSGEFKDPTTMADLSCGLHLMLAMGGDLDTQQVNTVIDRALAWGVIQSSDKTKVRAALARKAEARLEMKLGGNVFRAMLARWSPSREGELATALARATPWLSVRPDPDGRVVLYKKVWAGYMRDKATWSENDVRRTVKRALKTAGAGQALYEFEGRSGEQGFGNIADIIRNNGVLPSLWERWNEEGYSSVPAKGLNLAMRDLLHHIGSKAPPDAYLPALFNQSFVPLGGQTFHIMTLGAYILELATLKGVPALRVERTLTVTSGKTTTVFGPPFQ